MLNTLVKTWNYGNYSSSNYGSSRAVKVGTLTLYFSYETIIAFHSRKDGLVVSENNWSRTTGKHLNWIQRDKDSRIDYCEFQEKLEENLAEHGLLEERLAA
jgi:hypothetical protein